MWALFFFFTIFCIFQIFYSEYCITYVAVLGFGFGFSARDWRFISKRPKSKWWGAGEAQFCGRGRPGIRGSGESSHLILCVLKATAEDGAGGTGCRSELGDMWSARTTTTETQCSPSCWLLPGYLVLSHLRSLNRLPGAGLLAQKLNSSLPSFNNYFPVQPFVSPRGADIVA